MVRIRNNTCTDSQNHRRVYFAVSVAQIVSIIVHHPNIHRYQTSLFLFHIQKLNTPFTDQIIKITILLLQVVNITVLYF